MIGRRRSLAVTQVAKEIAMLLTIESLVRTFEALMYGTDNDKKSGHGRASVSRT
jgi:hypothetical protein